jgi:hypothetical protein
MCEEIMKLKITWRPPTLPPPPDPTRYTAVTGEESSRNRWPKLATPAGFEATEIIAKKCETGPASTEKENSTSVSHGLAGSGCSKCSKTARLALVAANAVKNGDLFRAMEVLGMMAGKFGRKPAS